jgi:DNA-binding NarL/FixJ family response regulator
LQALAVNIAESGRFLILKNRQHSRSIDQPAKSSDAALTTAEKRVLSLVSASMTNREIASSLRISPATVKRHMENIMHKLRLRNRVAAAIYGLSMDGCCAANNGDCPLVAWRNRHDNGRNGPIGG